MSFRKQNLNVTPKNSSKSGFTSYDDVYAIIKDTIDESSEFYELEPALVLSVLLDPKDFPKIEGPNNIGKIPDYSYMGTIKARFLESQKRGDSIAGFIKPLSPHIIAYPIQGEIVNVALHAKQLYYYNPLNLHNKANMNVTNIQNTDGKVSAEATEFNRSIFPEHGDVVLNGRFGNGLKLGSDPSYQYPDIKISNNQSVPPPKKLDDYYPHAQNMNADGSSIFMTSGPIRKEDHIIPAALSTSTPDVLDGDMVTINSDKLVFNAKGNSRQKGNNGDIHMFSSKNCNLVANNEINLELGVGSFGRITLGDPESVNPILKGNQTETLLNDILSSISKFSNSLSTVTGVAEVATAAKIMLKEINNLKDNDLPQIKSDMVFIGENFSDEITEINEVVAEPQQIFRTSGVQG